MFLVLSDQFFIFSHDRVSPLDRVQWRPFTRTAYGYSVILFLHISTIQETLPS